MSARIQAAPSFVRDVRRAREFLEQQDAACAEAHYTALLARLE